MNIEFIKTCEYEKYSDAEHKIVYFDKNLEREAITLYPIKLGYEKIKVTADMTIDDLKVGDLLISKDHAEFYVGIAYSSEYYRNNADLTEDLKKKSGTKVIHDTYGPHRRLVSGDKAPGTFGWGNVHDEFPVEDKNGKHYTYFFKNDGEANIKLILNYTNIT